MLHGVPTFGVTTTTDGEVCVISVTGELDLQTTPELRAALEAAEAGDSRRIMLSLSGVTFIDSTAVRLLLETAARSDRVRIITNAGVDRVLELSGMYDHLPLVE